MSSYQYRDSHYKDDRVSRLYYVYNKNSHSRKDRLYFHYIDVIMTTMTSQITSLRTGTKGQLRGKCFHLMTSSCWARVSPYLDHTILVVNSIEAVDDDDEGGALLGAHTALSQYTLEVRVFGRGRLETIRAPTQYKDRLSQVWGFPWWDGRETVLSLT